MTDDKYCVSFEVTGTGLSKAGLECFIKHSIRRALSPPLHDQRILDSSAKAQIENLKIVEIKQTK